MLETLTILPMAPGTRSRRADVLRRAAPVLLPKPKRPLQQTTLGRYQQPRPSLLNAAQQPAPPLPMTLKEPKQTPNARLQKAPHNNPTGSSNRLNRPNAPQQRPSVHQQPLSFASAVSSRSIQDILNHADSMRLKRKSDGSDLASNGDGDRNDAVAIKRPRVAVDLARPLRQPGAAAAVTVTHAPPKPKHRLLAASLTPATTAAATLTTTASRRPPHLSLSASTTTSRISFTSPPAQRSPETPPTTAKAPAPSSPPASSPSTTSARSKRLPSPQPASQLAAKHADKATHGFNEERESSRVTPTEAVVVASRPPEGGRKLRSQEATRFKSDLSQYFPEYDEVIGNDPKEEHILNADTPILLVESRAAHSTPVRSSPLAGSLRSSSRLHAAPVSVPVPVHGYSDRLYYDVFDSHVLDFTFLAARYQGKTTTDPLPDAYFEQHHKRAERLERSIRNTEKGRAQHEKDQIIRLLEGLQGPDWLRIMGVSGITESKKKAFEPAREHFIRGCRGILEKFRLWSVEEKRRKTEKDRAHARELRVAREEAAAAAGVSGRGRRRGECGRSRTGTGRGASTAAATAATADRPTKTRKRRDKASELGDEEGDQVAALSDDASVGPSDEDVEMDDMDDDSRPDSNDFDAVITRQLQEEVLAHSRASAAAGPIKRRKPRQSEESDAAAGGVSVSESAAPAGEVRSFFQKRYQRDAALSKSRRKGRTVMAWGQPLREPVEADFDLPGGFKEVDGGNTSRRGDRGGRGSRGGRAGRGRSASIRGKRGGARGARGRGGNEGT